MTEQRNIMFIPMDEDGIRRLIPALIPLDYAAAHAYKASRRFMRVQTPWSNSFNGLVSCYLLAGWTLINTGETVIHEEGCDQIHYWAAFVLRPDDHISYYAGESSAHP